jgi:hypothetical protein
MMITSLARGEAIRKENVIPRGIPVSKKPINIGMAEQEQNGVRTPNTPAKAFAGSEGIDLRRFRIVSAGTHDRTSAIINMISTSKRDIFRKVEIKKTRVIEILSLSAKGKA